MSQTTDQTRTQTQWDTYFHGHVSADRKIELEKMKEKFDTWLSECNKKTFFKKIRSSHTSISLSLWSNSNLLNSNLVAQIY